MAASGLRSRLSSSLRDRLRNTLRSGSDEMPDGTWRLAAVSRRRLAQVALCASCVLATGTPVAPGAPGARGAGGPGRAGGTALADDAGDATVAAALLKSGKAALAKKSYDEAITLFERALRESPEAVEAEYQRAVALERKGSRTEALAAYRRFLDRLKTKKDAGAAAADETTLGPLAEKRVAALAVGEQELARLEDQFAAQLMAFARKTSAKDPAIACDALRTLLRGRPADAEARALLEKLGGDEEAPAAAPDAPSGEGPFASIGVTEWTDMIARKTFVSGAIKYGDPGFAIDTEGGILVAPSEHVDWGSKYAYELEVKVTDERQRAWLVGLTFGVKGADFHTAFLQRGQVVLNHGNSETRANDDLATAPLKSFDMAAWHRLGVVVDGAKVEVWFDGRKVLTGTALGRPDLTGDLGIFQQRCRAEWRLLRAGRIE